MKQELDKVSQEYNNFKEINSKNISIGKALNKELDKLKKCPTVGNPTAQRLYVMVWAKNPKSSAEVMSLIIPSIINDYLASLGVVQDIEFAEKIVNASPCAETLKSMLQV